MGERLAACKQRAVTDQGEPKWRPLVALRSGDDRFRAVQRQEAALKERFGTRFGIWRKWGGAKARFVGTYPDEVQFFSRNGKGFVEKVGVRRGVDDNRIGKGKALCLPAVEALSAGTARIKFSPFENLFVVC